MRKINPPRRSIGQAMGCPRMDMLSALCLVLRSSEGPLHLPWRDCFWGAYFYQPIAGFAWLTRWGVYRSFIAFWLACSGSTLLGDFYSLLAEDATRESLRSCYTCFPSWPCSFSRSLSESLSLRRHRRAVAQLLCVWTTLIAIQGTVLEPVLGMGVFVIGRDRQLTATQAGADRVLRDSPP